jgi:hypothetical protein
METDSLIMKFFKKKLENGHKRKLQVHNEKDVKIPTFKLHSYL